MTLSVFIQLVNLRAVDKSIGDARTSTYVILVRDQEVDGSNPFAPTISFATNNLKTHNSQVSAWCWTMRSIVQVLSLRPLQIPTFIGLRCLYYFDSNDGLCTNVDQLRRSSAQEAPPTSHAFSTLRLQKNRSEISAGGTERRRICSECR